MMCVWKRLIVTNMISLKEKKKMKLFTDIGSVLIVKICDLGLTGSVFRYRKRNRKCVLHVSIELYM